MGIKKLSCTEFWDEYMGNIGYQIEEFFEEKCLDKTDIVSIHYSVIYDEEEKIARSYCLLVYEYEPIEVQLGAEPEGFLIYPDELGEYGDHEEHEPFPD